MLPVIYKIGSLEIYTYGASMFIAYVLALTVDSILCRWSKIPIWTFLEFIVGSIVLGVMGSRGLFLFNELIHHSSWPTAEYMHELFFQKRGLVFYGAPLVAVPYILWFSKKVALPKWRVLDIAVVGLSLSQGVGRLGCLGGGCCFGRPTGSSFGIFLDTPAVRGAGYLGLALHPTQLYESISMFILFGYLFYFFRKKKFDGQISLIYFTSYACIRFFIEFFRGDYIQRKFVINGVLSTSQFIALMILLISMAVLFIKAEKQKRVSMNALELSTR